MRTAALHDEVIDAALACAATLLGMDLVFIAGIEGSVFRFERVRGDWPGIAEGDEVELAATFCHQMLSGAPASTADAAVDAVYAATPARTIYGITSYVGVAIRGGGGVFGTLCGIDRDGVQVPDHALGVLTELAGIVAAHLGRAAEDEALVIRRTSRGWAVGEVGHEPSLTSAMVLADLLADDLEATRRPERPAAELDELGRLRASVSQLEYALAARVLVEQAIGVLAERHEMCPREAFEALRKVARRGGIRVHLLARDVVASVTEPTTPLPAELCELRASR